MDKIRDFFHFVQAWKIWHALFHDYIWLDWILFTACVIVVVFGLRKGFDFFFGKLIQLLIIVFAVMLLYPWCADWASERLAFAKSVFWQPVFFVVICAGIVFLIQKISHLQPGKAPVQLQPLGDRLVGAFAGFFFAILMLSFLSQFVLLLPEKSVKEVYEVGKSRYGYILRDFVPYLIDGTMTPIRSIVNHKVPRA